MHLCSTYLESGFVACRTSFSKAFNYGWQFSNVMLFFATLIYRDCRVSSIIHLAQFNSAIDNLSNE